MSIGLLSGESFQPEILMQFIDFNAMASRDLSIAMLLIVILFANSLDYNFIRLWAGLMSNAFVRF